MCQGKCARVEVAETSTETPKNEPVAALSQRGCRRATCGIDLLSANVSAFTAAAAGSPNPVFCSPDNPACDELGHGHST